ncbi:UNVERIFIED_ORG: hypothetical protein M2193_001834 [Bradyrhizobium japonicum]|jgi:hypothetical protein|uniref:hypothetical protein n=1 Tax=Bradyrhizobium TaxID=374 RepID=UPI003495D20E
MLAIFNRWFGPKPVKPTTTIIDQQAYFDLLERRQKKWQDDLREREADRARIAAVVWTWARDCVTFDEQRPLPTEAIPSEIKSWALGLVAREVMALAGSNDCRIYAHIFEKDPIAGVRKVQRLPRQAALQFPKPKAPAVMRRRLA